MLRGPVLLLNLTAIPVSVAASFVARPLMPWSSAYFIDIDQGVPPYDIMSDEVTQRAYRATPYHGNSTRNSYYRYEETGERAARSTWHAQQSWAHACPHSVIVCVRVLC